MRDIKAKGVEAARYNPPCQPDFLALRPESYRFAQPERSCHNRIYAALGAVKPRVKRHCRDTAADEPRRLYIGGRARAERCERAKIQRMVRNNSIKPVLFRVFAGIVRYVERKEDFFRFMLRVRQHGQPVVVPFAAVGLRQKAAKPGIKQGCFHI